MTLSGDHLAPGSKHKGGGTNPMPSVFHGRVIKIAPLFMDDLTTDGGKPNTACIYLHVQPVENTDAAAAMKVYLLSNMASSAGGAIAIPRIGEVVVCMSLTPDSSFVIGAVHGYTNKPKETKYHLPWPFAATKGDPVTTNDAGVLAQGTGFRVPDQTDPDASWDLATSPGGTPTGGSVTDGKLLDANLFFNVGCSAWGNNASPVKDTTFTNSSYGFQQVQTLVSSAKDAAYKSSSANKSATVSKADPSDTEFTTNTGLGFNEIMIRSRKASSSDGSSGSWETAGAGGVSVYGQDYVDLWSTGSVTTIAKNNLSFAAGEKLVIEAGTEISLRVGRSGITLTEDGVVISQTNCEAITSYWKMTPFSIESFALNEVHTAWFFSVVGIWSSLNMGPGTFAATGMMNATISSGAYSYFGLGTLSTAAMTAAIPIDATSGATGAVSDVGQTVLLSQLGLPINIKYDKNIQNNTLPTCNLGLSAATAVTSIVSSVVGTFIPSVVASATTGNCFMGSSGVACIGNNIAVNAGFQTGAGGSMVPVSKGSVRIQATQSVGMFGYMGPAVASDGAAAGYLKALQVAKWGSVGAAVAGGIALATMKNKATKFFSAVTLAPSGSCLFHSESAGIMAPETLTANVLEDIVDGVLPSIQAALIQSGKPLLTAQEEQDGTSE